MADAQSHKTDMARAEATCAQDEKAFRRSLANTFALSSLGLAAVAMAGSLLMGTISFDVGLAMGGYFTPVFITSIIFGAIACSYGASCGGRFHLFVIAFALALAGLTFALYFGAIAMSSLGIVQTGQETSLWNVLFSGHGL